MKTLFWSELSQIISAHKTHPETAFKWSCHFLFSRLGTLYCCQTLFAKASLTHWFAQLYVRGGMVAQLPWSKKIVCSSWNTLQLNLPTIEEKIPFVSLWLLFLSRFSYCVLVWGGLVFSVNSDNYHLKASSQHSVIFPDLSWTRSLALISSQISRILKQVHWEYLWVVSAELLPQSVFQPRCLGKAVGHLFPDCFFWWWPTWPSAEAGWKTQLWHHRRRWLKTWKLLFFRLYFHNIPFASERDIFS